MASELPWVLTSYTLTGSEETHTFDENMTEVILHAVDGNVTIGMETGALDHTILSATSRVFRNKNMRGKTLYFDGTGTKIFEILEVTGVVDG
jgi:hypothetical protein